MSLPAPLAKDPLWLEWRRAGIGGSDAAAIAGLSPWRHPYAVWLEKTGQLPPGSVEESEAMRWGTLLEPVIADEFERRSELDVIRRQSRVEHPREPWRRVTLDGIVVSRHDEIPLGAYEGKTTSALRWGLDWSEGIPTHYAIQVQHTLAVLDLDRAWVTCLVGGQSLRIFQVERDPVAIEVLLGIEREFWARVTGELPPPPVDGGLPTARAIREAFHESTPGKTVDLSRARVPLYELLNAKAEQREAETRVRRAEGELMAALGDAEVGELDGEPVVTWKAHDERRLDQAALREAEPEVAERFTRTSTVRRFLLKKGAGANG